MCKEIIAISTDGDEWNKYEDKGGYTVHPVPTLDVNIFLNNNIYNDGGESQNLILFIRGKAVSGEPNINGIK